MSTDRASPSTSWILPVLFALMGGSGILLSSSGLSSPRPRSDSLLWNEAIDEGRAPARLWQDPLLAAQQKHAQEIAAQKPSSDPPTAKTAPQQPDHAASPTQVATQPPQEPSRQPAAPAPALGRLIRAIDNRRADGLLVLGVGISGERWPGSEESRMADRYAVLAGLGARGYVPVEREYIDFFQADGVPKRVLGRWGLSSPSDTPAFLVPYEWFTRDGTATPSAAPQAQPLPRHVLILWLRTDRISKDQRLATLEWLLHKQLNLLCAPRSARTRIAILAPTGSNMLVDLLVEDSGMRADDPPSSWEECAPCAGRRGQPPQMFGLPLRPLAGSCSFKPSSPLAGVCFYSWNATISPDRLREQVAGRISPEALAAYAQVLDTLTSTDPSPDPATHSRSRSRTLEKALLNCGATLTRTIGDDAQLAGAIVEELAKRDALPSPRERRVLILHEWDTVYGRAMQSTFRSAFVAKHIAGVSDDNTAEWFSTYAYLRGIDGVVPGARPIEESGAETKPSDRQPAPSADRPVGRAQFDYIRRLVAEIEKENERNIAEGKGRFSAIGVVGGDTYDKLVLLQAVRQAFPEIVLFTTDLEARFVHPSSGPFNLNVIVASHFGLTPDETPLPSASAPALTWRPPPFRNSYQTSLCAATRIAVDGPAVAMPRPEPKLFEVARRGRAWELAAASARPAWRTHPLVLLAGGSCISLFALALWMFFRPEQRGASGRGEWTVLTRVIGFLLLTTVLAPAFFVLLYRGVASLPGEEPFLWTAGISAWPPILIQGATVWLSLAALVGMFVLLTRSNEKLEDLLGVSAPIDRRDPVYSVFLRAVTGHTPANATFRPRIRIFGWNPDRPPTPADAPPRAQAPPPSPPDSDRVVRFTLALAVFVRTCAVRMKLILTTIFTLSGGRFLSGFAKNAARAFARGARGFGRFLVAVFNAFCGEPEPRAQHFEPTRDAIVAEYFDRGWPLSRALRVVVLSMLVLFTVVPLALAFGWPANPARGFLSRNLFTLASWTSFGAVCIVTIAVLDATRLCQRFIENLSAARAGWSADVLRKMKENFGLEGKPAEHAADMLIVEERTRVVGNLFYFPVACALLLSLSTLSIFDRWTWTFPAALPFILCFGLTMLAAAALRQAAERARAEALRKLTALEGRPAAASGSAGDAPKSGEEGANGPCNDGQPHPPGATQRSDSTPTDNNRHDAPIGEPKPVADPQQSR